MSQARVAVVTDSTADLPADLAAERALHVVPLTVIVDGTPYLDGVEISPEAFYERLRGDGVTATTSQPTPARFAETYRELLADHEEVVSLHISARLSGTVAAARQGAEQAGAGRVHVVDSGFVSMPLGLLALAAGTMAAGGEPAPEILAQLARLREQMRVYFMVDTLEHLRRGGRIGRARALLGSVLQLKPVLTIQEGEVAPFARVRTHEKALARLIELSAEGGGRLCALVGHAAAGTAARRVAEALEPRAESLIVAPLGPVVGAHAGPGTCGVGLYPADLFPLGIRRLGAAAAS